VYKTYISLEVRVLLQPSTLPALKTFCGCAIPGGGEAEDISCPVCRGEWSLPGADSPAPRLNPGAVRKACLLIRSLGCSIVREAVYERNLAVPPMPKGPDGKPLIALSCLSLKLGTGGGLDIPIRRRRKRIRIAEVRLEEDAGRLTHSARGPSGQSETRMDYSSAGMPSLRLRTEADFEISEEAEIFLGELRRQLQYLGIVPGASGARTPLGKPVSLENVIRCNAYAAMAPYPEGPKHFVKLRNLNSINFVGKAVNAELSRQEAIVLAGGTVLEESRVWNEAKNASEFFQMWSREKPRFQKENLPPFIPDLPEDSAASPGADFFIEPPEARRNRLMAEYGLTRHQAEFVCEEKARADYFEKTLARGAAGREAARWMGAYISKECKRLGLSMADSPLSPERFAAILAILRERRIHGSIARQTISAVLEEDRDPETIIRERGWEQLTNRDTLRAIVASVIKANPQEERRIREGDARPAQFLTGLIMKETGGLADPALVKDILKEELSVSLVYVLSLGGAVSGQAGEDAAAETGDEAALRELFAPAREAGGDDVADLPKVRFERIRRGRARTEISPSHWAVLIEAIAEKLNSGTAKGIVILHRSGALSYTAPLIYWLFADAGAPVVFAAASPGGAVEAGATLKKAVSLALEKDTGVYVAQGDRVLSPLNLQFERPGAGGFRNRTMGSPVFSGASLLPGALETDRYVLTKLLETAVNSLCVLRVYPGIRADYLISLMDRGVKNFFLEIDDAGSAGFRDGPHSLKRAFSLGRRQGVRFYCSFRQEGPADPSVRALSRDLRQAGAVPMGPYATETAVARCLAASVIADNEEELARLMDCAGAPAEGPALEPGFAMF
jgi:aspartyl-tRNA(Asn)/glutamyl-tRNA(Gln) amidotransferase subunit B